jgi:hypothetical protein
VDVEEVVLAGKVKVEPYSSHSMRFSGTFVVGDGTFVGCMPTQLVECDGNQERSRLAARAGTVVTTMLSGRCDFEGATGMRKGRHQMASDDAYGCCSCTFLSLWM